MEKVLIGRYSKPQGRRGLCYSRAIRRRWNLTSAGPASVGEIVGRRTALGQIPGTAEARARTGGRGGVSEENVPQTAVFCGRSRQRTAVRQGKWNDN